MRMRKRKVANSATEVLLDRMMDADVLQTASTAGSCCAEASIVWDKVSTRKSSQNMSLLTPTHLCTGAPSQRSTWESFFNQAQLSSQTKPSEQKSPPIAPPLQLQSTAAEAPENTQLHCPFGSR
jgi:hypothetical protein